MANVGRRVASGSGAQGAAAPARRFQPAVLKPDAWAAAMRTRLMQKTLKAGCQLDGELMILTGAPSGLHGVAAVVGSSKNLSADDLPPHVLLLAEEALKVPVVGSITSAVRCADQLALMDRRVAVSPMPAARLVFHPETCDAMYLVRPIAVRVQQEARSYHFLSAGCQPRHARTY